MNFLPKNISHLRKRYRITQASIGVWVNKGQTTIGNWENQVSEPSIGELQILANNFGITVANLLEVDLEKTNLITEEMVTEFGKKGSLEGSRIGKLTGSKLPYNTNPEEIDNTMQDNDASMGWVIMKELKEIRQELRQLRDVVEPRRKK